MPRSIATARGLLNDLATDSFNRADAATLGNADSGQAWTLDNGAFAIVSNTARKTGVPESIADLSVGQADVDITLTESLPAGNNGDAGILFRFVDLSNYWRWQIRRNTAGNYDGNLTRRVAGVNTNMGGVSVTPGSTVVLRVVALGSLITVYSGGVQRAQVIDTALVTATRHGIYDSNDEGSRATFDDLTILKTT